MCAHHEAECAEQPSAARRLLLVHAHPDDESINSGATMAKYAAEGAHVTLVTCTLGDEGEILLESESHRCVAREDSLGSYRWRELLAATAALGVTDIRLLGDSAGTGIARWRDSGMAGDGSNNREEAFVNANADAVDALVDILLEVQPQVVVTYDHKGGYGHPDHVKAHDITHAAVAIAASEGWRVSKVYACARVREVEQQDREQLRALADAAPFRVGDDDFSWTVPEREVTTEIAAEIFLPQKIAALQAHATQVSVAAPWYALSDGIGAALRGTEYFVCDVGIPERIDNHREDDLFAGIET